MGTGEKERKKESEEGPRLADNCYNRTSLVMGEGERNN